MHNIKNFNKFKIYEEITESFDQILNDSEFSNNNDVISIINKHEEVFDKYDLPEEEINNIKNGIVDAIKVKYNDTESD